MALIICPECGREISDKAASCPGCGYPVECGTPQEKSGYENIVNEIYSRNPKNKVKAIKEFRELTGMNLKPAKDIMDKKYAGMDISGVIKKSTLVQAKIIDNKIKSKESSQQIKESSQQIIESLNTLANLSTSSKVAKCPKCHSTSISYDTKKLSLGRAAVGGAVAGAPGAVLGGLTSKKKYAVCLKCGKRWKI